jgi:hypothetical protein
LHFGPTEQGVAYGPMAWGGAPKPPLGLIRGACSGVVVWFDPRYACPFRPLHAFETLKL